MKVRRYDSPNYYEVERRKVIHARGEMEKREENGKGVERGCNGINDGGTRDSVNWMLQYGLTARCVLTAINHHEAN